MLSVFGSNLSDVALFSMAFMITQSPEKTSYIISLRLLSSLLVFLVTPNMLSILSMRMFSLITDLIRSISCLLVIFTWNIYLLLLFSIIVSFCTGINSALENAAFQRFVASEERISFISKQQFFYNAFGLSAPIVSAMLIKFFNIKLVFCLESILFLFSALIVYQLEGWNSESAPKSKGVFSGFTSIMQDKIQRNILWFRLCILTSMVAYQIVSTYILTSEYLKIIIWLDLVFLNSYSDVIALFSVISTVAILMGSVFSGKVFKMETIKNSFTIGTILLSAGCLFWVMPAGGVIVLGYMFGTLIIFMGLSLLRVSLYASGQELTDKDKFPEIIVTSDLISRTYQSLLGVVIVSVINFITPQGVFLLLSFSALASLLFSVSIYKPIMQTRDNK